MSVKKILVVYHSQEKGNTRRMAELVAQGCRQVEGVQVQVIDVNERRVDTHTAEEADAYAVGSPDYFSYVAGNVKQFFDDILLASWRGRNTVEKPYVGFVTHGGGGVALASMEKLAKSAKLVQAAPGVACRGAPESEEDVQRSVDLGRALGEYVVG